MEKTVDFNYIISDYNTMVKREENIMLENFINTVISKASELARSMDDGMISLNQLDAIIRSTNEYTDIHFHTLEDAVMEVETILENQGRLGD
jgi:hypothetical protein